LFANDLLSETHEGILTEFLHVITADRFVQLLSRFDRLDHERIPLDGSLHRIAFKDVIALEDLPEGARSTVDGYAVRAEDTFGASDSIPAFLDVTAAVAMGVMPGFEIHAGQAAQIPTGGFLPRGADSVVMVEYTSPAGTNSIEVTRPVTVKTNVLEKGEDAKSGEALLHAGRMLRPQELGFLAALGVTEVSVYRQPRVAVISSGDEVIPIDRKPHLGQIRDANSHAISGLVRACGAEPILFDIVPDNTMMLGETLRKGLQLADVIVMSGGSSVGARDLMVEVVADLPDVEILAHGVAIRPGKPTLLAGRKGKAIIGLPGHPVSALIVAQVFLAPFLRYLQGGKLEKGPLGHRVNAALATSIHSTIGLEEFVRVRLEEAALQEAALQETALQETAENEYIAFPIFGKSGMLSTMVKASGIIIIPMNTEGFSKGAVVQAIQS
jgi:molybdopterin molybdotransferase